MFLLVGLLTIVGWSGPREDAKVADPQKRVTYDVSFPNAAHHEARFASIGRTGGLTARF
jgi:hypothetical protein